MERQLAEAIVLAESAEWARFENKWTTCMDALAAHVRYEESQLFPDLAKSGTPETQAAAQLKAEHQSITKDVEVVDRESQQPEFFIDQLRHLLQRLQLHKQKEERILYPGLSAIHGRSLRPGWP